MLTWYYFTESPDFELPVIDGVPGNMNPNTDPGLPTAVVNWTQPTAMDDSGIDTFTSSHNSGFAFPIGETFVSFTATDIYGNVAIAGFVILVIGMFANNFVLYNMTLIRPSHTPQRTCGVPRAGIHRFI